MTRLAAKLALLIISLAAALGLAEAVLRGAGYEYRPLEITAGERGDARVYHLFEDAHFIYDPELIWRPKPGFGVFNSLGFRGPEVAERNRKIRIAAVGDSNTLGWAEADGPNWPGDLERQLAAEGVESEVVNAGVWGYSSHQGVPRTRQVLELEPDVVLISFGANDAHQVVRSDAEFSGHPPAGSRFERAFRSLRSAQLLASVLDRAEGGEGEPRRRVGLDDYRRNLEIMIDEARAAGAVPVLLTRPFVGPVLGERGWKSLGPEYNLATTEVAEERGALVVDIYSYFKDVDQLFADESHFTAEGHRLAAGVVLDHLRPLLAAR